MTDGDPCRRLVRFRDPGVGRTLLLVVLSGALCLGGCYSGTRPPRVGHAALDFTIQDSERTVALRQFRGQVVVVNFWASWCPPCIAETPSLVRMQTRLKGKGIVVLGVSADEDEAAYHAFIRKYDISFLTIRDPPAKVQHLYGTIQIPESYIIDANGVLRRKIVNAIDWESPEIINFLSALAVELHLKAGRSPFDVNSLHKRALLAERP